MTKRTKERKFNIIITNPDEPIHPTRIRLFAKWLLQFGVREGIITDLRTGKCEKIPPESPLYNIYF